MDEAIEALKREASRHCGENEYIGDDWLIHCSICGEAKQVLVGEPNCAPHLLHTKAMPRLCKCDVEEGDRQRAESVRREIEEMTKEARNDCFGTSGFVSARFDTAEPSKQMEACRKYAREFLKEYAGRSAKAEGVGLILYGAVGSGKTFLASCIANDLVDQGQRVKFTTLADLCDQIAGNYGNTSAVLDSLARYDLVVLDELGVSDLEEDSGRTAKRIYRIVNRLYDSKTPMVITTNVPPDVFSDAKGPNYRIFSRLLGRCARIEVSGKDRRADESAKALKLVGEMMRHGH